MSTLLTLFTSPVVLSPAILCIDRGACLRACSVLLGVFANIGMTHFVLR